MGDEEKLLSDLICENRDVLEASSEIIRRQFDKELISEDPCDCFLQNLNLENITLYPYQIAAIQWMKLRYDRGISCIIADEMGLGKTLQTLGFLSILKNISDKNESANVIFQCLILCPLSVIGIWNDEIHRYWSQCRVIPYAGNKAERRAIRANLRSTHISSPHHPGCSLPTEADETSDPNIVVQENDREASLFVSSSKVDILLVSYEMFIKDNTALLQCVWTCVVVDEAHRLKSFESVLHRILAKSYIGKDTIEEQNYVFKILLTGTPLQNNLEEFGSLLHFIVPSILPTIDAATPILQETFSNPLSGIGALVSKLIQLVMLRRRRDEIPASLWTLPEKTEYDLFVPLTKLQRLIYLTLVSRNSIVVRKQLLALQQARRTVSHSEEITGSRGEYHQQQSACLKGSLNNLCIQLRKCADHPYLFPSVEPEPYSDGPHIYMASGKCIVLEKLLTHFKSVGSRVLIFSGSTQMLDIIQDHLDLRGDSYERLDGSIRGEERLEAIKRFSQSGQTINSTPSSQLFAFLLSTRAGGIGLNLTAADVVIFIDSDWNPQADLQALSRAFRQGQTKQVKIIRLISKDTVDEIVWFRAREKLHFVASVLGENSMSCTKVDTIDVGTLLEVISYGIDELNDKGDGISEYFSDPITTESIENDPTVQRIMQMPIETLLRSDSQGILPTDRESSTERKSKDELIERDHVGSVSEVEPSCQKKQRGLYEFEGMDYSKRAKQERVLEDEFVLTSLEKLSRVGGSIMQGGRASKKPMTTSLTIRPSEHKEKSELSAQQLKIQHEERQKRRQASWLKHYGYISKAVELHEDEVENVNDLHLIDSVESFEDINSNQNLLVPELNHIRGDATKPVMGSPWVILHFVDASGKWPDAGFFSALCSTFGPFIQSYYESAGHVRDLKLGDLHLIPIPQQQQSSLISSASSPRKDNIADLSLSSFSREITATATNCFIGLLVGQRRHDRQSSRGSIVLDMNSIKKGLLKLRQAMISISGSGGNDGSTFPEHEKHHCTLHLARTGTFQQWYSIERLIRRYIGQYGIDVWIYYYRKFMQQAVLSKRNKHREQSWASVATQITSCKDKQLKLENGEQLNGTTLNQETSDFGESEASNVSEASSSSEAFELGKKKRVRTKSNEQQAGTSSKKQKSVWDELKLML